MANCLFRIFTEGESDDGDPDDGDPYLLPRFSSVSAAVN